MQNYHFMLKRSALKVPILQHKWLSPDGKRVGLDPGQIEEDQKFLGHNHIKNITVYKTKEFLYFSNWVTLFTAGHLIFKVTVLKYTCADNC